MYSNPLKTAALISTILIALSVLLLSCNDHSGQKRIDSESSEISATETLPSNKTARRDQRPNIILIICDDLGYADVGFNGSKDIKTPALDRLANNGIIFTSAYVPHPFCGPSRAGILTGRYPHTIGAQYNLPPNNNGFQTVPDIDSIVQGVSLKEKFLSKVLQQSGYYTGAIGKWHLGATAKYHPNQRGFDEFYGFLGGGHTYFPSSFEPIRKDSEKEVPRNVWDYLLPLEYNGKQVEEKEYITDGLSREAVNFVQKAATKENPFFLYLAYNAPHTPLEAKEEDRKHYMHITDTIRRTYAAMVHAVDRGVGRLVESLEKTNQLDNTLLVFLSDNGGRTDSGGSNFPLRGEKGNTTEGGFRVPLFFYWPKKITTGKTYDFPVSALDFYPTFSQLADVTLSRDKVIDGKAIWKDVITGENARKGELIYALRHQGGTNEVGVRKDQWKAYKQGKSRWQLFDLDRDKEELFDVSDSHSELVEELVLDAKKWSQKHTPPLWFHNEEAGKNWQKTNMPNFDKTFETP